MLAFKVFTSALCSCAFAAGEVIEEMRRISGMHPNVWNPWGHRVMGSV